MIVRHPTPSSYNSSSSFSTLQPRHHQHKHSRVNSSIPFPIQNGRLFGFYQFPAGYFCAWSVEQLLATLHFTNISNSKNHILFGKEAEDFFVVHQVVHIFRLLVSIHLLFITKSTPTQLATETLVIIHSEWILTKLDPTKLTPPWSTNRDSSGVTVQPNQMFDFITIACQHYKLVYLQIFLTPPLPFNS